ncbi:MAG TPA: HaeIII family restriction endonuclease [Spirochaetota bacterium]|nr:HaeIII family restriction endonuclease [Spirochaetota bacterium]HOR44197.1 HaeIII family restriction endonuclease [Spirochaetota bacterium]HPK55159.1 HaeIII family restriction endonuclease [Spirochaetota bacterium]
MIENSKQMISGKAFEYALLKEFFEKLSKETTVQVIENAAYITAEECFSRIDKNEKSRYLLSASFAVNFMIDIEPRLSNGINKKDLLQLEILTDNHGQEGDVRDVLAIRLMQKWEIGISAKNNHHAVKHSRLSNDIDFGDKWLGVNCSSEYFENVAPVFDLLKKIKIDSKSTQKWDTLGNYHESIYKPILEAFRNELLKLYSMNKKQVASRMIEYLVGNKDFYKVIRSTNHIEIQAFNLHGTLNLPFKDKFPKFVTPIVGLPDQIIDVQFKENSLTTIIVKFNKGWELSFRIHNASSRIEPSLKFDINLLSAPHTLFKNTLSVNTI